MDSEIIDKIRSIPIMRHKEPFRPTRKPEDLEKLLFINSKLNSSDQSRKLNSILLKFVFWTGLRVSEICNLKLEHVHLGDDKILVLNGKGGKNRWVAIHPELKTDLQEYVDERR